MKLPQQIIEVQSSREPVRSPFTLVSLVAPFAINQGPVRGLERRSAVKGRLVRNEQFVAESVTGQELSLIDLAPTAGR